MNSAHVRQIGLSMGFFLLSLPFSGFVAILPYVQSEWQGTNVSSGFGFSTWILGQLLAAAVVIPFIGKIEIRRLILIAAVLLLAQNLLYPYLAVNYLSNGVLRCIGGLAHLTIYVAGIQLLSNQFKQVNRGRTIGIWGGYTSGANVWAALQRARRLGKGKKVVTVIIDSGWKYLNGDLYN